MIKEKLLSTLGVRQENTSKIGGHHDNSHIQASTDADFQTDGIYSDGYVGNANALITAEEANNAISALDGISAAEASGNAVRNTAGLGAVNAINTAYVTHAQSPTYAPDSLIVKFKGDAGIQSNGAHVKALAALGQPQDVAATETISLTGAQIWHLSGNITVEQAVAKYQASGLFEYVQPDYILRVDPILATPASLANPINASAGVTPNDPGFPQLWGLNNTGQTGGKADADIDALEAWQIQTGNHNLVIGVIDTGVDYTHPDLANNIWTNPGELVNGVYVQDGIDNDGNGYVDDIHGWDFVNNDNNPMDDYGHGTHVAGTIAGQGNNGIGVTGVDWSAQVMPLKFLGASGSGSTSDAIKALDYATKMGVKLTNNSWGGGGYTQALADAIQAAGNKGALFIAAAGNGGSDQIGDNNDVTPNYPSNYNLSNIIAVAATTNADSLSSFSNYGPVSVDLGAPGSSIYSTLPVNGSPLGQNYGTLSGTSMATPFVTGAAALLWSQHPDWTAQQIKDVLLQTADPVASLVGKTVSGGRLNVNDALLYNPAPTADHAPMFSSSGIPAAFTEKGTAVALDKLIQVYDAELAAQGQYAEASLALARHGGPLAEDVFSATGNLSFSGGNLMLSGVNIGTVSNQGGLLAIVFNANATQARVNEALSSIAYANSSDASSASVQLDWNFSDGNQGPQGTGGVLTGSVATRVNISGVNDAPTLKLSPRADGKVTTDFGSESRGASVAVQADGKILVAGVNSHAGDNDFALARYNRDGSLDASFGQNGKLTTDFGSNEQGNSVVLLSDGKILVAGSGSSGGSFALARYTSDGSLDATFDGDGKVATVFGFGNSATLQADGKILVAGSVYSGQSTYYDFALARYNSDGSLDASFDGDGKVVTDFASTSAGATRDEAQSILVQADGKIVLAGYSSIGNNFIFALARYNQNGSLDTSFDGDGKVTTGFGASTSSSIYSATLQPDGKILVAGSSGVLISDFALARYNSDGSLDTSFGGNGKVMTELGGPRDWGWSVKLQADGKILVAGYTGDPAGGVIALVRYNNDGSLDQSFDGDGMVTTPIGLYDTSANSVTLQADGKIVVAGYTYNNGNYGDPSSYREFAVVRYNSDGSLDSSFDSPAQIENGPAVALDNLIQIYDTELAAGDNYAGASVTLSRHGGASAQDVFSASGNLSFSNGSAVLSGVNIGSVSQGGGTLIFSFNGNATQARVNEAVSLLAYSNISDAPPASAQIDWTFSDGNTGGQGSGGALKAIDSTTVAILAVNDAPSGADKAIISLEDTAYALAAADFGFSDVDGNSLAAVKIGSLPTAGGLTLNGSALAVGQFVSATDIAANKLVFTPAANANGSNYASFTFQVQDSGGTANGGIDLDPSANKINFNVTAVNDAPALTGSKAILAAGTEDTAYTIAQASLLTGFTDVEGGSLAVTGLTADNGSLSAFNPATGSWVFTPNANYNGAVNLGYGVTDGTATTAATQSFNLAAVNDAPTLTGFAAAVATGSEDTETPITLAQLQAQGDEADIDGTVTAFVVKAVSSGTLKIGLSAATASAWNAASNNTIDAAHQAWWTPAANANGTLNAFAVVAKDGGGLESATPTQAQVAVAAAPDVSLSPGDNPVEGPVTPGFFNISLDSPAPAGGLTVNFSLAGTATLTTDYTLSAGSNITGLTGGSFTIAEGQTAATLKVNALADAVADPGETVSLNLGAGAGYQLGAGSLSFASKADYAAAYVSYSIAVDDFNRDGRPDLAVANWGDNTVSVLLRNAANTGFDAKLDYATGSNPLSVAVGDFNGDGKPDLAVANASGNTVSVLLRNAANTGFDAKQDYATGSIARSVAVGDFNGDGKPDLAVANQSSNTVSVLLRNATNTGFDTKLDYATGSIPYSVAVGDFNGDGKPDLAVVNVIDNTVSVLLRNTTNTDFDAKLDYATGSSPYSVAVGDVNGDGKPDLAVANWRSNTVSVLLRNSANTGFDAKQDYATGSYPYSVAIGDFNGDGKPDLAVTNNGGNTVSVLLRNTGNTGFDSKIDYATGANPAAVVAKDFNGDNQVDLAVTGIYSGAVSVYQNNTTPSATLTIIDNAAPKLAAGGATNFIEQTPVAVAAGVTVNDANGDADWNGGKLAVQITANAAADDSLILPSANTGGIWLNGAGNVLMANATAIGTASAASASGNSVWTFSFNTAASNALVQATAQAIQFANASDAPATAARTVTFTATDKNLASGSATQTLGVTPVNDAPAGTDTSAAALEGVGYALKAADFGFTDPNDNPANNLLAVKIASLPAAGALKLDGIAVTPGQFVGAADIAAGKLVFTPAAEGKISFDFQVQDDGGSGNGGVDLDPTPNTLSFNIASANHAPGGTDGTLALVEDGSYTFAVADFGFTDPDDSPANSLLAVKIASLPAAGTLTLNGASVAAGQFVSAANLADGLLQFTPAANANGSGYASFDFQVQDDGGGSDLDPTPNRLALNVASVNDAPVGADSRAALLEDGSCTLAAADFAFADPNDNPANSLLAVKIASLPAAGTLKLNGVAVTAGQSVSVADIVAGKLVFTPAANGNGAGYASLGFQVQDNGGTGNGGSDLDQTPNTLSFAVTSVNDAPAGTDKTAATLEDTAYTLKAADFGFTDPNDSPANSLLAVKIASLPALGTLRLDGVAVTAGQFVSAADIAANKLVFTPAANASGAGYASLGFQVQDNGGTGNGGGDLDLTANTLSFAVTSVNDAPAGANKAVATLEDTAYTLKAADFGFTDPNDSPANSLLAVEIASLPAAGTLKLAGAAVTAGQFVSAADIAAGKLVFTPAANASGSAYTSLSFQAQDNGGTGNGGVNLDPTPNTLTFAVASVNDAPAGDDKTATLLEDSAYSLKTADFGYSDANDSPANSLLAVKIASLPAAGALKLAGVAVTAGQFVSAADIAAGKLVFTPGANANGGAYASLGFQVQDNGGTGNGGVNLDPTANTLTFSVSAVNDAPAGADKTVTALEDAAYVFKAADFGYTDANDNPANSLLSVKIASLPAAGTLTLNDVAVVVGQSVSADDIAAGLLEFTVPVADANGSAYASFAFQVQDDGGGADLDPTPNTLTLDIASVNDAPAGADNTLAVAEDGAHAFALADFGYSDANDSPANSLLAVKIASLPAAGALTLGGAAVAAGQSVSAADIAAGLLLFTPAANANGYASFDFQVQDDGGSGNGGVDLDPTPNTLGFNIASVNDAPTGGNKTASLSEDTAYTLKTADFGYSDPNDSPANSLLAVKIATLPAAGTLKLAGVAVTAGQFVSAADIAANKLVFAPTANGNGASYAGLSFQVQDNGGTSNGGVDLDPTPNTLSFAVSAVNDAPAGTNKTATTLEDAAYALKAADFGFTDPNDSPANSLLAVKIDTLPTVGALKLNGVELVAGQTVSAAEIAAGKLVFTPLANANASSYASLTFQVQDNGGTSGGGVNLDPTPNTLTLAVTRVNDAPAGADKTVTLLEDTAYTLKTADFGYSDPNDSPANSLLAVKIASLPAAGALKLAGAAVTAGQFVSAADIAAGKLVFAPAANGNGASYASLGFQVQDNGGAGNGGVNLDPTANTLTFNVGAVNDSPTGADKTTSLLEDGAYTLKAADFGYADANDSPANNLLAVKIASLPAAGTLTLNDAAVVAGQSVSAADLSAGLLVFTPAADANGSAYASFDFQVQDDSGLAGDLDPTPNTLTFDVASVNDAPVGTDTTLALAEDGAYPLAAADFGLVDPNDNPANNLLAVKIVSLPAAGALTLNGSAVAVGQSLSAADIAAGLLVFTPAANANGGGYASFDFQVQDDGGSGNGGADLSATPNTLTLDVASVNDAPAGANKTAALLEDARYTLKTADFGYADPNDSPANSFLAVRIASLPAVGALKLNGAAVAAGQFVSAADIAASKLVFTPAANGNGAGYASLGFQVQDNGGTSNGGSDLDATPNTLTFAVSNINDAPAGTDKTAATLEDTAYALKAADFGFTDPNDSPANSLLAVKIASLPALGTLKLNGAAVAAGQFVSAADIGANKLVFTPAANANGSAYASLGFQVQDDGGTSNGGVNLDATPNTLTLSVTPVRDDLNLTGTAGNDTLNGDQIDAGSYDTLSGLAGNDTLNGLAGNDILLGGDGDDRLDGGSGADKMDGGAGNDSYFVDNTFDSVTEAANAGIDTVSSSLAAYTLPANVENLNLSGAGNPNGSGNALDNLLTGNTGNNTLDGGAGIDTVSYANATADVTVKLSLATAQNTLGAGVDKLLNIENLTGSDFNDTLSGNTLANALKGGLGKDTLGGGDGSDSFVYTAATDSTAAAAGRDLITDFSSTQGDKLDVKAIDANALLAGMQRWAYVPALTGAAGQVTFDAANHLVLFDQNGDKAADFAIELAGVATLAATDFIFA